MNRNRIRALLGYMKGFKWLLFVGLIFMAIEIFVSFISPLVMSVTIDSVLDSKPADVPGYFRWFITMVGGDEGLRQDVLRSLLIMAAATVGFKFVSGLLTFLRTYVNSKASEGIIKRLRDRVYEHVQALPFRYHATAQTGDLIQRSTNDVETVRRFISGTLLEFVRTILLFVVGIFVMANLNFPLAMITLALSPFIIITSMVFMKKIQNLFMELEEQESKMYTVVQENLTGTRVVRAFGRQRFEMDKFLKENEGLRDKTIKLNNMFANLWAALDVVSGLQIAMVAIFGIVFAVRGDISVGEYTAFTSYVYIFIWPLRSFGRVLSDLGRSLISVGRIEEVLNTPIEDEVADGSTPSLKGDIDFNDVSFGYEDGTKVLDHLDMHIKGGSTAAILGGTGSGKSTLAQLLQRLYDVDSGAIKIGGVDINEMQKKHLRDHIGIVLQEPFLYSKTIMDNIGIKLESVDKERVYEAARVAAIHDDIESFDQGYDTVVGERGVTLSGGQKQRVAIARALVGDSDILIFDDSLSAVDAKTDAQIRDALKSRREGTTTIIISHRITTLMEADRIFVLKDGKVAEQGTHAELLAEGGIYKRTYDIQSMQAEEEVTA